MQAALAAVMWEVAAMWVAAAMAAVTGKLSGFSKKARLLRQAGLFFVATERWASNPQYIFLRNLLRFSVAVEGNHCL
jgi:hypothetical protein